MKNQRDYVYDIESIPNFFSCDVKHPFSGSRWFFEVSDWQNDAPAFCDFMHSLQHHQCRMIGYNNEEYDYQVIHHCLTIGPAFTSHDAYDKTDFLINTGTKEEKFGATIWPNQRFVEQIDLYKIHHFDNFAKATSLKVLQVNMRSSNIGDLPFEHSKPITKEMRPIIKSYNQHDVDETEKFAEYSKPQIEFRENLIDTMGVDVMNYNDTKIGKKYFEQQIRKQAPHLLGTYKNKKQTHRDKINLNDVILPYVAFNDPSLQNVLNYLKATSITETKAPPQLKDVSATLQGFTVHIGAGGGHGSISRRCVRPSDGYSLIDVDVASYYPNLAISNRFYPEHLSELFCDIYEDVYKQRKQHAKKTAPNEMLKLALNGVYGDSCNEYSIFYDPQYTMKITINGQLLLCMLMEELFHKTNVEMVQLNTDGITFLIKNDYLDNMRAICKSWEQLTGLELEEAEYSAMWIRDVNNYIAQTKSGKLKRIGAYAYETARENPATREVGWHKDHSALVVQKAAESEMVHGVSIEDFIYGHADGYDFLLKAKAPNGAYLRLMQENDADEPLTGELENAVFNATAGTKLQKVTRYFISHQGSELQKVMKPLAKAAYRDRVIGINKGWKITVCDDIRDFDGSQINYEWYIQEARKLVIT